MRIEIRKCLLCKEEKEIPQKLKHATNVCPDCSRIRQRDYQRAEAIREGRRVGTTGRVPYPLEEGYSHTSNKFRLMAIQTFKCNTKEEWRELMRYRLDYTLNNKELMSWINSHDGDEPKDKKQKRIETDYPDTRYMDWEEWEKGGWGDDVDS